MLQGAKNAALILGMGPLARPDGAAILGLARGVAERFGMVREDWNGFNVLHTAAARVGGLDLGLLPAEGGRDVAGILEGAASGEIEVVFLIGADEIDTGPLADAFVVYQGHHGDRGATVADVVLPGAAYTEKHATYVNTEGRPQRAKLAVFPPGDAKEDWKILRALSEVLGRTIRLDTLAQVRGRMAEMAPHLAAIDQIEHAAWGEFGAGGGTTDKAPFALAGPELLPDEPDQPRLGHHAGLRRRDPRGRRRGAQPRAGGDRHPWLIRSGPSSASSSRSWRSSSRCWWRWPTSPTPSAR